MNCAEAGRLLNPYVDGELELRSALAVEEHLQGCSRCQVSAAGLHALRAAVNRACEPPLAPARLRASVRRSLSSAAPAAPAVWRHPWLVAAPGIAALLLAIWMLLAQPWQGPAASHAADGARVVYHVASNDNVSAILRTLKNHLDAAPGLQVVVVAHNNGIEFLLQGAVDEGGRPYAAAVRDFRQRGVEFRVCTNTLTRRHIDAAAVIPEAVLVPSGIVEISRLQSREGYTYLRL
jgi:intracellular sulfur oxidation DsrE/DsrF family protein